MTHLIQDALHTHYLDDADHSFHRRTGIRLPDPSFDEAKHRAYDKLAYEIAYGSGAADDWAFADDPDAFLRRIGGVLAIPVGLANVL